MQRRILGVVIRAASLWSVSHLRCRSVPSVLSALRSLLTLINLSLESYFNSSFASTSSTSSSTYPWPITTFNMAQSPSRDQTTRKSVGSSHTNDGTRLKLKHVDNSGQDGLTETHDPNQNNNPSDAQKSYEQDDVMDNATSVSHTSTSSDDNEEDSDYEGVTTNQVNYPPS
jgi:hypothetical protein